MSVALEGGMRNIIILTVVVCKSNPMEMLLEQVQKFKIQIRMVEDTDHVLVQMADQRHLIKLGKEY